MQGDSGSLILVSRHRVLPHPFGVPLPDRGCSQATAPAHPAGLCRSVPDLGLHLPGNTAGDRHHAAVSHAGSRFVLAGAFLYGVLRWRGEAKPPTVAWKDAAIIGGLLLLGGNGGVSWAQQYVPTGVSALIVASVPLWIVVTDWLRPGGTRPRATVMIGLALGFFGVVLMVLGKDSKGHPVVIPLGAAVLVLSTITWRSAPSTPAMPSCRDPL